MKGEEEITRRELNGSKDKRKVGGRMDESTDEETEGEVEERRKTG